MSDTGLPIFDTTLQETNALLSEIELALSWQGRKHDAYKALRAVLLTLRDRLTIEEAVQFSAQLPMLVRGMFFSEWVPSQVPMKMDKKAFLFTIAERGAFLSEDVEQITKVVLQAVKTYVSAGEIADIKGDLPEDIAALLA